MFNFGLIVIIFLFSLISIEATLIERLKKFDTFHHDSMHHHVNKRDLYTQYPNDRGLEFDSLGRHFKISLHKEKDLFSPNFRVVVVENEVEREIEFHPNLYHGILEGDKKSYVNAYLDDDGTLTGTVETESGKYVFEPSWRHLPDQKNITMIAYEEDDVDFERDLGKNFCGYIKVKTDEEKLKESEEIDVEENDSEETESESETETEMKEDNLNEPKYRRSKRASSCTKDDKMICTVLLVADYRFFRNMGNNNYQRTAGYLISQIDQINQIYSKQMFGSCGNGFEFEIREIRIHNDPSPEDDTKYPKYPYNIERDNWDTTDLLETFSRDQNFESFCLAHLFTYTAFSNGVLGLAYIGSSRQYSVGGICSSSYNKNGRPLYLNTGWSSSLNRYNRKLLTTEACLVTAHEFGHNWGSEHDPDTDECSPSANTGGKYIMFTYSVSGREDNNKVFSPCSRRSIGAVIKSKAQTCFSKRTGAFCGNYKIDDGEQCDEGPDDAANQNQVKCCSKCKLTPGAICSDTNHQCCDKCNYASRDKNCTGEQDFGCKAASKCSGEDTKCGAATIKPNGTSCLDTGKCVNGKCLSICEFNNKVPCICDTVERSCRWCCKDNSPNATCRPFSSHNGEMNLPVGTPCLQGLCDEKGECIKQVYNSIQRIWSIIENMDVNQLVMFMRANIVGTVIILSLVIWIPASCIIAAIDKRNAKKEMDEVDWFNPKNEKVLGPKESETLNIRQSNVRPHQTKNLKLFIPPRN